MNEFGYAKIACITPRVFVTDPKKNAEEILRLAQNECPDADIVLTPELCIPSYSALKLFSNTGFEEECTKAVIDLAEKVNTRSLFVVGTHISVGNGLYNCAVALNKGRPIAAVPKEYIPNYNEFEEAQWFSIADENEIPSSIKFGKYAIPFGTRLLFRGKKASQTNKKSLASTTIVDGRQPEDLVAFIELCEAIWMIIPPSSFGAIAGANVLLNPSASTETIGKAEQRRVHVISQSGRAQAVYAYCSSGPTESTSDVVFSGHDMIAECGTMLVEKDAIGDHDTPPERDGYVVVAEVDIEKCMKDRRQQTSYTQAHRVISHMVFREVDWTYELKTLLNTPKLKLTHRKISGHPFVPQAGADLHKRCARIFNLKQCSLAKRLEHIGVDRIKEGKTKLVQGISGGLDSTASLMNVIYTLDMLGIPRSRHYSFTMPGFGTTGRTKNNAWQLMQACGVTAGEIDIRPACLEEFKVYANVEGYKPFGVIELRPETTVEEFEAMLTDLPPEIRIRGDLKFENTQARRRTEYLMNMGIVIGTGDMSELDQGWCTFNADHQSMFNPNCSTPKTLVKFEVDYIAKHRTPEGVLRNTLQDIVDTEISPELLPPAKDGSIEQSTENMIGPFELIDFRMFYHVRAGFSPTKILWLASQVEDWLREGGYDLRELSDWQEKQIRRNFIAQFKRDDVPNGPKLGSVSYSPRAGNWRQASDARPDAFIENLKDGFASIYANLH